MYTVGCYLESIRPPEGFKVVIKLNSHLHCVYTKTWTKLDDDFVKNGSINRIQLLFDTIKIFHEKFFIKGH